MTFCFSLQKFHSSAIKVNILWEFLGKIDLYFRERRFVKCLLPPMVRNGEWWGASLAQPGQILSQPMRKCSIKVHLAGAGISLANLRIRLPSSDMAILIWEKLVSQLTWVQDLGILVNMAEGSLVKMREVWLYERLGWQPFFQSLEQCYLTAEDMKCWIGANYFITDLPEKTKKMPLQVLGHQALVLSEPKVKTKELTYSV